ncbi:MAG: DUF6577 family protein [Bacteroidales bacterium]
MYICILKNKPIIAKDKLYIEEFKQHFKGINTFKTADIANFYRSFEPDIKQTTLNWRAYNLVEKGILERIGKGIFKIGINTIFIPNLDNKAKNIYKKIKSEFPFVDYCIWETSIFNEFSLHHSNKHFILVEVEKESAESVFLSLKEQNNKVFFNPNLEILEQYIFNISQPIIVKLLISEAPLQKIKDYNTVTLEKILVDLFCEEDLFNFYQGREKNTIFRTAYEKYTINNTKLLRYASRRGKKEGIENYINQIIGKL